MSDKEETIEVELSRESYGRFLRAGGRPDLNWFLQQSDEDQEIMAEMGDEIAHDRIVAQAYAIHDPDAAAVDIDIEEAEERVIIRMGAAMIAKLAGDPSRSPSAEPTETPRHIEGSGRSKTTGRRKDPLSEGPVTMGGMSRRRETRKDAKREDIRASRTMMGKAPDKVEVGNES